jgi:hypothetical protein
VVGLVVPTVTIAPVEKRGIIGHDIHNGQPHIHDQAVKPLGSVRTMIFSSFVSVMATLMPTSGESLTSKRRSCFGRYEQCQ